MDQKTIDKMIGGQRVALTRWQSFMHYSFPLFILFLACLPLYDPIKSYFNHPTFVDSTRDLSGMSMFLILLALVTFLIQRRRLRFSVYSVEYTDEQLDEALKVTVQVDKWRIIKHQKNIIQAIHPSTLWAGVEAGEMITVVKLKKQLLINSITDPDQNGGVLFPKQHRRNIATLLENLNSVINQVPQKIVSSTGQEREWTPKKILSRLILYPLCIMLIAIGAFLFFTDSKAAIPGIAIIGVSVVYLYSDLKIITKKSNKHL